MAASSLRGRGKITAGSSSIRPLVRLARKPALLITVGVVLAVLTSGYLVYPQTIGRDIGEQKAAAAYLEKKYGKQFEVQDDPDSIVKRAIGDAPKFDGLAHAKDDPSLMFHVGRQTNPVLPFHDDYLGRLWAQQQRKPVGQFLATIFNPIPSYTIEIFPSDRVKNLPKGSVPNYETIERQSGNEIDYFLTIRVKDDLTGSNREMHAKNAYLSLEYLRNLGVGKVGIRYVIETEKDGERYRYIYDPPLSTLSLINGPQDIVDHLDDFKTKGWE